MANVMKVLKDEIARIARSEVNAALKPVKSVNATQRKYIADLRRQIADLEKDNKRLEDLIINGPSTAVPIDESSVDDVRGWFTAQGVRSVRKRLRLSQKDFAALAGVSLPTVAKWEGQKTGKINIRRKPVLARLQQIKQMGLREVKVILEEK